MKRYSIFIVTLFLNFYGGAESVYKTEIDSKVKVIARSSSGVGPAFFDVYYPNGLIETYGYTNDSKIFQNNTYNIAAWHLSFEQDRSGNRVTYTYTQDAVAKTHLLSRIAYNGYNVEFVYELKGDTSSRYIAPNTLLAEQHRLTQVLVKAGSVLTSYYRIGYQLSSNPSLVEKIEQCSASTCFPATRFAYELNGQDGTFDIRAEFPNSGYAVDANNYNFQLGNFNGDGKTDLIHFANSGYIHTWLSNGDGTFQISALFSPWNGYIADTI